MKTTVIFFVDARPIQYFRNDDDRLNLRWFELLPRFIFIPSRFVQYILSEKPLESQTRRLALKETQSRMMVRDCLVFGGDHKGYEVDTKDMK